MIGRTLAKKSSLLLAGTAAVVAMLAYACGADYYEIPIETPIQPKLDVTAFQRVLVAGFVAGGTEGGHVGRGHILHLVDEQGDPDAQVGRDRGGLGEQFREVDLQVAGICPAALGGHVNAQRDGDRGPLGRLGVAQGEGLEDTEEVLDPVRGANSPRQIGKRFAANSPSVSRSDL